MSERRSAGVRSPTLVVAGPLDGGGADRAIAIAAAIPAARLMMLEGTGHAPHREAPDRFADLLVDFVARSAPLPTSERKPT